MAGKTERKGGARAGGVEKIFFGAALYMLFCTKAPPGRLTPGEPRSHGQAVGEERMLEVGGSVAPATCENLRADRPAGCPAGGRARECAEALLQSWKGEMRKAERFREEKTYRLVVRWETLGRSGDRTRRQTGACCSLGNGHGNRGWRRRCSSAT